MSRQCLVFKIALAALTMLGVQGVANYGPNDTMCCPTPCSMGYFYADAAFLYCRASTNNLEYAIRESATVIPPGAPNVLSNGVVKLEDLHYSWDPGVRASIGFANTQSGIDLSLIGTYIHSKTASSIQLTPSFFVDGTSIDFLAPLINPPYMGVIVGSAAAEWKLDFGTLDLIASCCFNPVGCIQLMPNFGLRGAWIEQHYATTYEDVFFTNSDVVFPSTSSQFRTRYRGIGFKAGTDFTFPLIWQLNVIGGAGGSLVYGKMEFQENIQGFQVDNTGGVSVIEGNGITKNTHQIRANLESELGLSYMSLWGGLNWVVSASYFFDIWFDQNDFNNLVFTPTSELSAVGGQTNLVFLKQPANIQLQGLILRAGIAF